MPTYTFRDKKTGEKFDKFFTTYNLKLEYLDNNPNIESIIGTPSIVSGVGTRHRVDDGFRENISRIKEIHTANKINDH